MSDRERESIESRSFALDESEERVMLTRSSHRSNNLAWSGAAVTLCVALVSPASAQSGGPYDLSWNALRAGGGTSGAGPYVIAGTIGVYDAGVDSASSYVLLAGFWHGGSAATSVPGGTPGDSPADGVGDVTSGAPETTFQLLPARPNPFNPHTEIVFDLSRREVVDLAIYDASGARVRMLRAPSALEAGRHTLAWDGVNDSGHAVASGLYFARLTGEGRYDTGRMLLVR